MSVFLHPFITGEFMRSGNAHFQTFLRAALLFALLIGGSRVIKSLAFNNPTVENRLDESEGLYDQAASPDEEGLLLSVLEPQRINDPDHPDTVQIYQNQLYPDHDICAQAWRVDVDVIPAWLQTPVFADQLHTEIDYNLLAGELISSGLVDANECPNGGLLFNGAANACGLEIARPAVYAWQNQFDEAILIAAKENRVPAFLLKRLFARETQFWPGTSWLAYEYGLGQATSFGLDALFQYYPSYFQSICPAIFTGEACQKTYSNLSAEDQALIRGFMASRYLNADCSTCEAGIDIAVVTESIDVFAKLMVANCHQVNQILVNYTEEPAGYSSTYSDLWRMTLANYNAGSGCIDQAVDTLIDDKAEVNWVNMANQLINQGYACAGSIDYVFEISR